MASFEEQLKGLRQHPRLWDRRSNPSYGIRVTSARVVPSNAERYIGPLVQSVMKQLDDLDRTPTIYRRRQALQGGNLLFAGAWAIDQA